MRIAQNRKQQTIERIIRSFAHPQSEIWTDEWPGYSWLAKAPECQHYKVNHSKGQVSKPGKKGSNGVESD